MGVDSWPTGGPIVHPASDLGRSGTGSRPSRAGADYYAGSPTRGGSNGRVPPTTSQPASKAGRPTAPARHRSARVTPPRRSGGPLGDRRGLTAAGALVLLLVFGLVGAGLDHMFGHGLWVFFSIGFVAAVLINAMRVHLEDLGASIVIVPISYAIVGTTISLVGTLGSGNGLKQNLAAAAGVLVYGTPILLLSLLVAVFIAGGRARAATVARRRARTRAVRRFGDLPPGSRPRRRASSAPTKQTRR